MPHLRTFLDKMASSSLNVPANSSITFTQVFKLQRDVLLTVGSLIEDLNVRERETNLAVEALLPYLHCKQQKILQVIIENYVHSKKNSHEWGCVEIFVW